MQAHRMKIDRAFIERVNGDHHHRIDHYRKWLDDVTNDHDRHKRRDKQECVMCFHTGRIGGAAMTTRQCAWCDHTITCGNTNVDVLCKECAKRGGLCCHCGGDMDLKNRRKRDIPVATEDNDGSLF